eukprot:TRINITY_DN6484_c0_g2_i2.p2 TRINITY_DN6484_c0_g2~~TRINITY_DN6484_c0_g2_i2.p2  ORF type:complete len:107 (-),score=26.87 TRINITY_DN6484_c0_g2_i2:464-784(-)
MKTNPLPTQHKKDYRIKIVVIGPVHTGKTSIIRRFVNDSFTNNYKGTVGVDFALKIIDVDPYTRVHLQLWDVAGQDRFQAMTNIYYNNAAGTIFVCGVVKGGSFAV